MECLCIYITRELRLQWDTIPSKDSIQASQKILEFIINMDIYYVIYIYFLFCNKLKIDLNILSFTNNNE